MDAEGTSAIVQALDRLAATLQADAWDHVYTAVMVLTLVVLIWYSIETQRLRKVGQEQSEKTARLINEAQRQNEVSRHLLREARRQNEMSVMPILAVSVEPAPGGGADRIVLMNVGAGPAFNVSIERMQWGTRNLWIERGSSVLMSGQHNELQLHVVEGQSGHLLDAKALASWIHVKRIPGPLNVIIHCNSVNSRDYTFRFVCTSEQSRLRISYEGTAVAAENGPESQRVAS